MTGLGEGWVAGGGPNTVEAALLQTEKPSSYLDLDIIFSHFCTIFGLDAFTLYLKCPLYRNAIDATSENI